MNERDFYYWLQGYFELSGATELDACQVKMIKEHMALVSSKVTETSINNDETVKELSEDDIRKLLTDSARRTVIYPGRNQRYCENMPYFSEKLTC